MLQASRLGRKDRPDPWAGHGVPHAHDVDAGNTLSNVGVNVFEVREIVSFQ